MRLRFLDAKTAVHMIAPESTYPLDWLDWAPRQQMREFPQLLLLTFHISPHPALFLVPGQSLPAKSSPCLSQSTGPALLRASHLLRQRTAHHRLHRTMISAYDARPSTLLSMFSRKSAQDGHSCCVAPKRPAVLSVAFLPPSSVASTHRSIPMMNSRL